MTDSTNKVTNFNNTLPDNVIEILEILNAAKKHGPYLQRLIDGIFINKLNNSPATTTTSSSDGSLIRKNNSSASNLKTQGTITQPKL